MVTGLVLGAAGVLAGFAPSAAEPNNEFVSCGPALFGRPDPMPDPACADAYAPFDTLAVVLLAAAALALIIAGVILLRSRKAGSGSGTGPAPGSGRPTTGTAHKAQNDARTVEHPMTYNRSQVG